MEDYEISDVRSRNRRVPPLVSLDLNSSRRYAVFDLANVGEVAAEDVSFAFSPEIPWPGTKGVPHPLKNGIRRLAPRKCIRFRFFPFLHLYSPHSQVPRNFTVRISYFHPNVEERVSEDWPIDIDALRDSFDVVTELEQQVADVVDALGTNSEKLGRIEATLTPLRPLTSSTGLKLSAPTLRNLKRLIKDGKDIEPIDPMRCNLGEIRELLNVEGDMARTLYEIFNHSSSIRLEDVPGMTDELLQAIRSRFTIRDQR